MKNKLLFSVATLLTSLLASHAGAISIDWKGNYRFEWTQVDRPSLGTPYGMKSYGLNYLSLSPKIIATDGVTIVSKFDVLANQDPAYASAQFGSLWGQPGAAAPQSNVLAQNQRSTSLLVSQLYLNLNQEYGALVLGRAPIEFGLGITHNAGNGVFDHWADTEDLVGYKFIVDNLFFMPSFGRVYSQSAAQGNTVQDMILHLQYESKESGSLIGIMQQTRKASPGANDVPISGTMTRTGDYNVQTVSFILGRDWETFGFKVEAGFTSGNVGAQTSLGEDVKMNGYGVAAEVYFPRKDSKIDWNLRFGMATGDDPNSESTNEGFQFDRNYDIAMLLFNHRLGQQDFLGTNSIKDTATHTVANSLDDEAISNAMYISPRISYAWNDYLDLNNTLTYAQLMTNPVAGTTGFSKDLGLEWDIELVYKPTNRIQWVNQLGLLFPGAAFKNGTGAGGNLETASTYGFASKVGISF
ncbi:MAG: alginate export family protein [Pseudobdellovibrionaceae bacterium]